MRPTVPPVLDRRQFLRLGTAAAASLAGLPALHAAEPAGPFGGFLLALQTYTYRKFTLEQAVKKAHDLGLSYIEFTQRHLAVDSTPEQIKAVLALCKEYEVAPIAYGVQKFTKDHDANRKVFDFGKALGVRSLSADPDPDSFDSLDKLCADYGIAIAIHPHGPVKKGTELDRWYSAEVILAAVKDHHPLIGSCLDTGHLIRSALLDKQLDPAEQVRTMGARNFGMHLKDNDNPREAKAPGTECNVVFGQGVLDVPAVLKALRDVRFKGSISIEYESKPEEPTEDLKACIEVFKQSVRKLD